MNYPVLYLLTCVILCLSIANSSSSDTNTQLPLVCQKKCGNPINGTVTEIHCRSQTDRHMNGRCCVITKEGTIVGIDLQNCDINEETFSAGIVNMTDLLYISLQGNVISQITSEDFNRNTKIIYLSLPDNLSCPGGQSLWNDTNNSTGKPTECFGELDACKVHNLTCPENSHCEPSGIDQTECLCNEGYHGYKCMNQGTFPTLAFVLGLVIPTVVLSALLWVTQRRYVKTSNKNK